MARGALSDFGYSGLDVLHTGYLAPCFEFIAPGAPGLMPIFGARLMFSPKALPDRAFNWIPPINMSHLCGGGAVVLVRGVGAPRGAVVTTGVLRCRRSRHRAVGENRGGG